MKLPLKLGRNLNAFVHQRMGLAMASALLMTSAMLAGWSIVPVGAAKLPVVRYDLQGSTGIAGGDGPVFLLNDQQFPEQCGRAYLHEGGTLDLVPYRSKNCNIASVEWRPHLLPADLRVPWALVPPKERAQLQQLGAAAMEHLYRVAARLVHAPFFTRDYLPAIQDILGQAVETAWKAPATRQVLIQELGTLDPMGQLTEGLLPVVIEHARGNLWRSLRAAVAALTGEVDAEQRQVLTQFVDEVFADPRIHEHLEQRLPPLLSSPQSMTIAVTLARAVGQTLVRDPRAQELVLRLFTDQRFLGLRPLANEAQRWLMAVPEGLMRMRHRRDHNPLTTYVLHAQMRGQPRFLVLLLTPEQERQLAGSLPPEPLLGKLPL